MNQKREGMLAPALIGGAAAGFLSGIPFFNCLCCLWIIGGGILAAYLLAKDSPESLKPGDGAIAGILSGIVAAVVNALISVPLESVRRAHLPALVHLDDDLDDDLFPAHESTFPAKSARSRSVFTASSRALSRSGLPSSTSPQARGTSLPLSS